MIVPTMTESEIAAEVLADLPTVFRYVDTKDAKFRRMVLKATRFPVRAYSDYLSPRRNAWTILLQADSKRMIGDNALLTMYCTYESTHGTYACYYSLINAVMFVMIFPPHFFSRFALRMNLDLTGKALIRRYFEYNNSHALHAYSDGVCGTSIEGVALGKVTSENTILFKTFISYTMTKGEQVGEFSSLNAYREVMQAHSLENDLLSKRQNSKEFRAGRSYGADGVETC